MVVYLDVLFVVNALMDGATLLAAARLGGARIGRGRLAFAACLGGGYSVLAAVKPMLAAFPLRLLLGAGICAAAFGVKTHFARICALYFVTAGCFAGFAAGLGALSGRRLLYGAGYYFAVPLRTLALAAALAYAASGVLLRGDMMHSVRRETETMTVRFDGRTRALRVLHDTGNELIEPVSGRPVLVLERAAAQELLGVPSGASADAASLLASLPPETARRCGLLPFSAVGTEQGLLLYFRPDAVQHASGVLDCVCAVGPANLGRGAYEGLIGE